MKKSYLTCPSPIFDAGDSVHKGIVKGVYKTFVKNSSIPHNKDILHHSVRHFHWAVRDGLSIDLLIQAEHPRVSVEHHQELNDI